MSHCCLGYNRNTVVIDSPWIYYSPLVFIYFCHFCWLPWLTRQFEDVWLFIISQVVSGLELKSFILDWFFSKFVFYHMTFYTQPVCQNCESESWSLSLSTPSELLGSGTDNLLWLYQKCSRFTKVQIHCQASIIDTIPVTTTFSFTQPSSSS